MTRLCLTLALAFFIPSLAWAAPVPRLEAVEVGTDEVTLHLSTNIKTNTFMVAEPPPRLVIELLDTEFAAAQRQSKGAGEYLKSVRANQFKSKPDKVVRVVLDLLQPAPYKTRWEENRLRISLGREAPPPAPAPEPAPPPPAPVSSIDLPGYRLAERTFDFALVVGIENYSDLPDAKFAERDAEAVKAHLLALGFPVQNVRAVSGDKAVRSALDKYIDTWLPRVTDKESRVLFYFAGHGSMDPRTGQPVLMPWDADPEYLADTGYSLERLYKRLAALKAGRVFVAIDASFFGAEGRSVAVQGQAVQAAETTVPKKLSVFTAVEGAHGASVLEDQGHGTFTTYFLKGLGGGAQDASGKITVQGLHDYLRPKVEEAARLQNREQVPGLRTRRDADLVQF
ncbi:MAG: caspase family protein [Elusimicrobiota bacterium]